MPTKVSLSERLAAAWSPSPVSNLWTTMNTEIGESLVHIAAGALLRLVPDPQKAYTQDPLSWEDFCKRHRGKRCQVLRIFPPQEARKIARGTLLSLLELEAFLCTARFLVKFDNEEEEYNISKDHLLYLK